MLTKLFGDKYYKDLLHAVKKRKKDSESISDADLSSLVMAWSHEGEFKSFTSLRAFRVFSSLPESTKRMATISFPLEKCSGYLLKAILKVHGYSLCERIKSGRYDTKTLRRIYKATTSVLWYRLTKFEGKKLHYLFEIRRAIETKAPHLASRKDYSRLARFALKPIDGFQRADPSGDLAEMSIRLELIAELLAFRHFSKETYRRLLDKLRHSIDSHKMRPPAPHVIRSPLFPTDYLVELLDNPFTNADPASAAKLNRVFREPELRSRIMRHLENPEVLGQAIFRSGDSVVLYDHLERSMEVAPDMVVKTLRAHPRWLTEMPKKKLEKLLTTSNESLRSRVFWLWLKQRASTSARLGQD